MNYTFRIFALMGAIFMAFGLLASPVLAATVGPSPASGTFDDDFNVTFNLDTESEDSSGVGLTITYDTSTISYVSYTAGDVPCDPLTVTDDSVAGEIDVSCLIELGAPSNGVFNGSDSLVIITFSPEAVGTAEVTIEITDNGGLTYTTSDGTYTISGTDGNSGGLPDTGLSPGVMLFMLGTLCIGGGYAVRRWGDQTMQFFLQQRWFEHKVGSRL